jgi:hypothetical protein
VFLTCSPNRAGVALLDEGSELLSGLDLFVWRVEACGVEVMSEAREGLDGPRDRGLGRGGKVCGLRGEEDAHVISIKGQADRAAEAFSAAR